MVFFSSLSAPALAAKGAFEARGCVVALHGMRGTKDCAHSGQCCHDRKDCMNTIAYSGHEGGHRGLAKGFCGDLYPYTVIRKGVNAEVFCAMDTCTGNEGQERRTYNEAEQDIYAWKLRNMMHS